MAIHRSSSTKRIYNLLNDNLPVSLRKLLRQAIGKVRIRRGLPAPGMLINESELRPQFRGALRDLQNSVGNDNIGDYLEFGVGRGTSIRLMYEELLSAGLDHIRLFGFDSFEGLPQDDEKLWIEGAYKTEIDVVMDSLSRRGIDWNRVTLVKGFYRDTLTDDLIVEHNLEKVSLIMIDCDLYQSAKEALDFCKQFILDEAVIFFDDWQPLAKQNKGEKRAFDEFLQENPEFTADATGVYSYWPGDFNGKVFRVSRTRT